MRRVTANIWVPAKKEYAVRAGNFHQWGMEVADPGSYTVAIIELDDGSVITTTPERVTFLDQADDKEGA